jgi:hypothetical protein
MSTANAIQYIVRFRMHALQDCDATTVWAHRIEGWSRDYAFFGDASDLSKVTCLIPRDVVGTVEMIDQEQLK